MIELGYICRSEFTASGIMISTFYQSEAFRVEWRHFVENVQLRTSQHSGEVYVKRLAYSFWSVSLILTIGCALVWAQATAQISGTARDQSGAVLPGVEITATQTDTGIARNTITNESGSYVLTNLPLGPY